MCVRVELKQKAFPVPDTEALDRCSLLSYSK